MKKIGAIILVIGALVTFLSSLVFTYNKESGNFNINPRHMHVTWLPITGAVLMVIGGGTYLFGIKKALSQP